MKKKLLNFLRVLLVAAGLGVEASAWGGTKTVTLFSQNFESVTAEAFGTLTAGTASTIWTKSSSYPATLVTGDETYGSYVSCTDTKKDNNQVANSIWFYTGSTDIYSYNEEPIKTYTVEFDALYWSNVRNNYLTLFMNGATVSLTDGGNGIGADKYIFYYSNGAWKSSTVKIVTHNNATFDMSSTDWFHYKFDIDGSTTGSVSITYTITNNTTGSSVKTGTYAVDLTAETPICDSYKCQGVYFGKGRYDGVLKADNFKVTAVVETDEDVANDPSFTLVGISGTNRTYRIGYTEGETLHYAFSTSGTPESEDYTTASGSTYYDYKATTSGTLYAYTTKGTATSETITQTVSATAVQLAAPTFTRGTYSGGNYSITISSDQTYVLLQPDVTLKYRIGDSGDYSEYSTAVSVPEGSTLYAYAYNANYTSSDVVSTATGDRSAITSGNWTADKIIDFYTSTRVSSTLTLSDEGTFTVGTTTYYPVVLGTTTFDDFGITSTNGLILDGRDGLYSWNANINAGIRGLKEGQYILITSNNGEKIASPSSNLTLCNEFSTSGDRVYRVNTDGNASFAFNKGSYTYLYDVTVCQQTVSATLGTNGYATFASPYALDLTNLPTGLTAYKAAVDGTTVTFTALNQTVPANTGILLQGEASGEYNIPVATSGTAVEGNAFLVNEGGTTFTADNDYYYFGLIKNTLTFGQFAPGTVAIPADKAYLKVLKSSIDESLSRALTISFADEATGINSVQGSGLTVNGYFNLNGQRVSQPAEGLYIVNGKKVIIK